MNNKGTSKNEKSHPVEVITNALSVRGQIHPDGESFYTYIYQIITKSIA